MSPIINNIILSLAIAAVIWLVFYVSVIMLRFPTRRDIRKCRDISYGEACKEYLKYLDNDKEYDDSAEPSNRQRVFPNIVPMSVVSLCLYTDQTVEDFIEQLFAISVIPPIEIYNAKVAYESRDSRSDTIAEAQITTSTVRINKTKMLLVEVLGIEYLLDPRELKKLYILDDDATVIGFRAYCVDTKRIVFMSVWRAMWKDEEVLNMDIDDIDITA